MKIYERVVWLHGTDPKAAMEMLAVKESRKQARQSAQIADEISNGPRSKVYRAVLRLEARG